MIGFWCLNHRHFIIRQQTLRRLNAATCRSPSFDGFVMRRLHARTHMYSRLVDLSPSTGGIGTVTRIFSPLLPGKSLREGEFRIASVATSRRLSELIATESIPMAEGSCCILGCRAGTGRATNIGCDGRRTTELQTRKIMRIRGVRRLPQDRVMDALLS